MNAMLGLPKSEELYNFNSLFFNRSFWEKKFFDLWMMAQSWDCAGKIRLETLKICCEDMKIPFCAKTREIILMIENIYRRKNG